MKVIAVQMYQCGGCKNLKKTATEADRCCFCKKCGTRPVLFEHGYRHGECARCLTKIRIRALQDEIRRLEAQLASNRESLEKHQAEKRALDDAEKNGPSPRLAVEG